MEDDDVPLAQARIASPHGSQPHLAPLSAGESPDDLPPLVDAPVVAAPALDEVDDADVDDEIARLQARLRDLEARRRAPRRRARAAAAPPPAAGRRVGGDRRGEAEIPAGDGDGDDDAGVAEAKVEVAEEAEVLVPTPNVADEVAAPPPEPTPLWVASPADERGYVETREEAPARDDDESVERQFRLDLRRAVEESLRPSSFATRAGGDDEEKKDEGSWRTSTRRKPARGAGAAGRARACGMLVPRHEIAFGVSRLYGDVIDVLLKDFSMEIQLRPNKFLFIFEPARLPTLAYSTGVDVHDGAAPGGAADGPGEGA
ncbi:sterol 14-demethylase [Aureococcus anophagefferens]|nr:sterol 14-demethylase [Aureococcus anophagefferens]